MADTSPGSGRDSLAIEEPSVAADQGNEGSEVLSHIGGHGVASWRDHRLSPAPESDLDSAVAAAEQPAPAVI